MKIYLDYIFLENLVVNIVMILETTIFTKSKVSQKRKVFVILLDTVLSCFCAINNYLNNYIFRIIYSLITLFVLFKPKTIYELFKKTLCFYMLYFLYMGLIISFSIILKLDLEILYNKLLIYIAAGLFFHFLCKDLWKIWKTNISERDLYYNLKINNNYIKAFVDTGNSVRDPITSLDVIFLKKSLKEKVICNDNVDKINIPVTTVNGTDFKEAYIIKNIIIYKGKKEVAKIDKILLSFTLNDSNTPEKYSAILGYDTYLEKLEGVIL